MRTGIGGELLPVPRVSRGAHSPTFRRPSHWRVETGDWRLLEPPIEELLGRDFDDGGLALFEGRIGFVDLELFVELGADLAKQRALADDFRLALRFDPAHVAPVRLVLVGHQRDPAVMLEIL